MEPAKDMARPGETLPVVERFVSINGEGRNAGKLAAFVRFAGCNLACSYCDTRWANEPGCASEPLSPAQICSWVAGTGVRLVTLTGGEPLLQPLAPSLIGALCREPGVRQVEVETNGSVDLAHFAYQRDENACAASLPLSFTMDWKLPSSGMADRMRPGNLALLDGRDTVKFVVGDQADLDEMLRVCEAGALFGRVPVYVSPVFGAIEPAALVTFMEENGLVDVTLQLQLHKIIWPGVDKGV